MDLTNTLVNKKRIEELLENGKRIGKEEFHPAEGGFPFSYVSGPQFNKWMGEIKTFAERHLVDHPLIEDIKLAYKRRSHSPEVYDDMIGYLETLVSDTEFWDSQKSDDNKIEESEKLHMGNKVFIVHGHDSAAKEAMARTLEKAGFEAIILHEQADMGMTIIEKIEKYTDVAFAVVLYTECDLGRAKEKNEADNRYRARQNVVFEHGYLIGKLGRGHVCAFVKGNVETPGDISGVVYTSMDDAGAWKMTLAKNMGAVGLEADIHKMI